jgi:hypothetical protein
MKLEELEQSKLELLHEKAIRLSTQEEMLRIQLQLVSKEAKEAVERRNEYMSTLHKKYELTDSQGIKLDTGEIIDVKRN